ncbi:glycosyltransferase family 4 protein [Ketogulonicigenium vulgare]|uniref:Glycosyl transferase group 1 n=1 Tax=Ketogulonicigenium vulgare (strain WSH-001) TaxID=759362 RepID=F9Y7A9_KETVW|nr:glycosyltransferase family 4 protein [Ketogulonicigenium vulgare]ADO42850.1 glycosyl transferase, group 1 [Ketogulonicigenium vulgare Y25]AEM41037.1 Glycosyl transferase group 1 [Ketogulonicigenium vulgare WSH-001]ALJ81185.1 glycosyl transferase family 1 [Ketogulonicigenium vulgare]ANW33928.1 glycosyl transferase family 1 [Ketogulonicigenium vulgare]AOZ54763.1 glycosyl transferase, group 1 [Ketogulonicigenium vulgare]
MTLPAAKVDVIAPNLKKRVSGVTSTIMRLVPLQARQIAIAATGPAIPPGIPQIPLRDLVTMPRSGPSGRRVWHARRNNEMLAGLALKYLLGKRLALVFTSASQREHTGFTRWLIRQMDEVVATSTRSASYLQRPATVIYHGIDTETFAPPTDRAALRARLGLPEGRLIGCYGRVRAQKGVDVFVDAMISTLPDHEGAHGIVMGGITDQHKDFVAAQKAKVAQAGLTARIHFLPEVTPLDMPLWFQALDLYIAPQRWEGFGLTPLESMACGVPVIATRVGAFEELILPDVTGRLVTPGDIAEMTAEIAAALAAPDRVAHWASACRPHVLDHFRIEGEADKLIALYRRLLAR